MQQALFDARHLTKRYGDNTVVDDLSFSIAAGECLGVIGPNGAGKTTTIRMCLGQTVPDSGEVSAFGLVMPRDALAIKAQLGVVTQFDTLDPDFTCAENLRVFGSYFGLRDADVRARVPQLLEFAALTSKQGAKPGELSGGMRSPSASISPASGTVRPRPMRIVVVLPAPFGPMTPRHSPGAIAKDRSCTTSCPP